MHLVTGPAVLALAVAGCNSQPQQANVANGTRNEVAVPQGALQASNVSRALNRVSGEGPMPQPSTAQQSDAQPSPADFVARYAALLQAHKFDDAYKLLDPSMNLTKKQFEQRLAPYKTIHAAVGKIGPVEGAAGSLYDTVQLTLTGEKADGSRYSLTGPVTLRRVNDVPGSTAAQRQWHIYKTDLSSNPKPQPEGDKS